MAQPGSVTNVKFPVIQLLEQAMLRAGVKTSAMRAENIQSALREFNLWLSGMSNRGTNLWCQDTSILGMRYGQSKIYLPTGTIDIKDANLRTYSRLTSNGVAGASQGVAAYAFDGDVSTACIQATPLGTIEYDFVGNSVRPTMIGYLNYNTYAEMDLTIQFWDTNMGSFIDYYNTGAFSLDPGQWAYWDISAQVESTIWRIQSNNTTYPLRCDELVIADSCTDIPIYRMNRDDYSTQPQKLQPTSRVLQYYMEQLIENGEEVQIVVPWPVSNTDFDCLQLFRTRQIQQVTDVKLVIECPQRWNDCLAWVIAYRLICTGTGDINRLTLVKGEMTEALDQVEGEERDNSELNLMPLITGYSGRR